MSERSGCRSQGKVVSEPAKRRQALICTADVKQCTTTGFVFTANAAAIPSAISFSSRIVTPSAPKERPQGR
jgi:hypothetical protein